MEIRRKADVMRGSWRASAIAILSVLALSAPGLAVKADESVTLEVLGEAPVYGGNIALAKETALENAFRVAVRQGIGTWVTAESFTRNFVSIEDSILTRTRGYIETYEIIDTTITVDSVSVFTRVTVSLSPLQADLTSLLGAIGNPRFAVLSEAASLGRAVESELERRGLTVVYIPESAWVEGMAPDVAARNAGSYPADVVVVLKASADYSRFLLPGREPHTSAGSHLWGCVLTLSANSYWVDTGEGLVSVSASSNGAGVSQETALGNAVGEAAPSLAEAFTERASEKWGDFLMNGRLLELSVSGLLYGEISEFRRRIEGVFGVKSVALRSFEGSAALLGVRFTGTSGTLADLISMTDFPSFSVSIIAVTMGRLDLEADLNP